MKVDVYNAQGKKDGQMDLSDVVFGVKEKKSVIHQVYVGLEANARQPWAHTKFKGEVRGGGKKPWKQKGTGRARHGSSRSPIWKGGGVTFGPRNIRHFTQKITQKMKQSAMRMSLSGRTKEEHLMVLDGFVSDGKTKTLNVLRTALPGAGRSTLLIETVNDQKLARAARNIPALHVQQAADVNVVDLLHHQYIIATKDAIATLEARLK
jgi:large subunit ribosomal protein L4